MSATTVSTKALLVYPEFPNTYWSFKHALPFVRKRSAYPPLGLLTLSSMLPASISRMAWTAPATSAVKIPDPSP